MMNDLKYEILSGINEINQCILEADINVATALMSYINKIEDIREFSESYELPLMHIESMIFMESKNRERDKTPRNDIAKWMEKKGYWYTGDNPKKKKECNRMYHFLQQHKFDPKTETYESDIDDGKGGKKRIPLKIDNNDKLSAYMTSKYSKSDTDSNYTVTDKSITLGRNNVTGKQHVSQLVLKHEEGHYNDWEKHDPRFPGSRYGELQVRFELLYKHDRKGIKKFIDEYGEDGAKVVIAYAHINKNIKELKWIWEHDKNVEELMADLYGAQHAKFRTKGAGKNNKQMIRNANVNDIKKSFKRLGYQTTVLLEGAKKLRHSYDEMCNVYKRNIKYWNSKLNILKKIESLDYRTKNALESCLERYTGSDTLLRSTRSIINTINRLRDLKFDDGSEEAKFKDKLDKADALSGFFDKYGIKSKRDLLIHDYVYSKEQFEHISESKQLNIPYPEMVRLNEIFDKYKMDPEESSKEDIDKVQKIVNKYIIPKINDKLKESRDKLETVEKYLRDTNECIDYSMQMRRDFVMKFVKEYFEELNNEYLFTEWSDE